jgi:hypothetical protein
MHFSVYESIHFNFLFSFSSNPVTVNKLITIREKEAMQQFRGGGRGEVKGGDKQGRPYVLKSRFFFLKENKKIKK